MSDWLKLILNDSSLNFHEKSLAMYFSTFMNIHHEYSFPSIERVQSDLKISFEAIENCVGALVSAGYLDSEKQKITYPKLINWEDR